MLDQKPADRTDEVIYLRRELAKRAGRPPDEARAMPALYYTSPAFLAAEIDEVLRREWMCIGHVGELRNPGDFFTTELLGEQLLAVHDADGVIRLGGIGVEYLARRRREELELPEVFREIPDGSGRQRLIVQGPAETVAQIPVDAVAIDARALEDAGESQCGFTLDVANVARILKLADKLEVLLVLVGVDKNAVDNPIGIVRRLPVERFVIVVGAEFERN